MPCPTMTSMGDLDDAIAKEERRRQAALTDADKLAAQEARRHAEGLKRAQAFIAKATAAGIEPVSLYLEPLDGDDSRLVHQEPRRRFLPTYSWRRGWHRKYKPRTDPPTHQGWPVARSDVSSGTYRTPTWRYSYVLTDGRGLAFRGDYLKTKYEVAPAAWFPNEVYATFLLDHASA